MSDIYIKTAQGQQEVENRTGTIPQKARRVLILVDGERNAAELAELSQIEAVEDMLALLQEAGLIEAGKPTTPTTASGGDFAPPQFRPVPAQVNAKELDMARQFIINTLKTFCGPMTHLSIVKAVTAATTHEQMRESYPAWHAAVMATAGGKSREAELVKMLLKVI